MTPPKITVRPWFACLLAVCILSGCGEDPAPQRTVDPEAAAAVVPEPTETPEAPPPVEVPDCATLRGPALTPEAERSETGARAVIVDWARSLELRQWDRAWCQFGDTGGASGQSFAEFRRDWDARGKITVAVPSGTMDGTAGSSYYTVPTRVGIAEADGSERVLMGEVILRRVNDVPGASEEDLRWHIASARLNEMPR